MYLGKYMLTLCCLYRVFIFCLMKCFEWNMFSQKTEFGLKTAISTLLPEAEIHCKIIVIMTSVLFIAKLSHNFNVIIACCMK